MSLNQELKSPRAFAISPRYLLIAGLAVAAILIAGCKSAPPETETEYRGAPPPSAESTDRADDMTATEAAIAGLNEAPAAESGAPTSQLLRPDAPMNYSVKRGD